MNHPYEQQAAAMARAGELPDGEQLRECINSGQVSAAQVVAHAEAGEIMVTPYISQAQFDRTFPVAHQEAGELPSLPRPAINAFADISESFLRADHYTAAKMHAHATAALAAERAEVARLREALERLAEAAADSIATGVNAGHLDSAYDNAMAALTAPGEKHD